MTVPLVILGGVIVAIAFRQVGGVRLQIWQIMAAGAAAMLLTRSIGPVEAFRAVDADVILFLLGMFVLGRALEESGYLGDLAYRLFRRARSVDGLSALILLAGGAGSAVFMNDTLAIIGVPVMVGLARAHRVPATLTLLALGFAITSGSVLSPIGNPQNLLVALGGSEAGNPFVTFARWLALPAVGALGLSYVALRLAFRRHFHGQALVHERVQIRDPALARLSAGALVVVLVLIALRVALVAAGPWNGLPLTAIAIAPAALLVAASPRRLDLVRGVDWATLGFFASLFIVTRAVDEAGVTAEVVARLGSRVASPPWILAVGACASQVVSNVPLVALYLPAVEAAGGGAKELMALAAGSTLAGNLTLIGAASNVIIVDTAERRFGERLSFWTFTHIGAPLAVAQLALTWALLAGA